MGQEVTCRVECPAGTGEAKAFLESTEVLVRGAFRWRVRFAELQSVEVKADMLVLNAASGTMALRLGESVAAKWADKIRNPPSLMKKMGVKLGSRYVIAGPAPRSFLSELEAAGAEEVNRGPELLFAFPESEADLAAVWDKAPAVWVIYPKGRKDLTEAQIRDHGRQAGMMDTKVASVSAVLTATRFSRVRSAV